MIDIRMYGAPKDGGTNIITSSQFSLQENNGSFTPRFIWGQYFDGSKNIDGDMKVNGTAYIDHITTMDVNADNINTSYVNTSYVNAKYGDFSYVNSDKMNANWMNTVKAYIEQLAAKEINTENLTVTGLAHFFEVVIDKVRASGGAVIFTPANGFKIRKFEEMNSFYRLYFLANDNGTRIDNMWKKDDQAFCQNFNMGGDKKYVYSEFAGMRRQPRIENSSNKYYWALVINTNNEDNNGEPITINVGNNENVDMQECHYIDISKNEFVGYLDVAEGDEIAMLGYRGEEIERQSAIYISAYKSIDGELLAPLFVQYKGINDFNLDSHKYTWFSGGVTPLGKMNKVQANQMTGSVLLSDGTTIEDNLSYITTYVSSALFSANENFLTVAQFNSYMDGMAGRLDEAVSWSYIKQHSDEINMQVVEGLKQTGIDIKSGQIVMDADNTTFLGNISLQNPDNGITIFDNNSTPRVVINRDRITKSGEGYVPNNISKVSKQTFDMTPYAKLGDYWTETKGNYKSRYTNNINGLYLGTFSSSESFDLHLGLTIRFTNRDYTKGVYDVPGWGSNDNGTYKFTYKVYRGSTTVVSNTVNLSGLTGIDISVTCNTAGDYYLDWSIDYQYDSDMIAQDYTYYTIGEYIDCSITRGTQGLTFIGTNGLYSSNNLDRYMVYSDDGFKVTEKDQRNITIGDSVHSITNPYYSIGLDPQKGPYWNYGENSAVQGESTSWAVPLGVPKLITLSESDFTDIQILNENGQTITVKGYNVNAYIYGMVRVEYLTQNVDHYIILPYAEPAQTIIYNYSDKNVFVYARNVGSNSKNIYFNQRKLTRNTGQWRFELEPTDECLWMIGDRNGWNNLSLIDR